MKEGIHPEYKETIIRCACGASYTTRSTRAGSIQVDICSACHPFFTGQQKLIDTDGRVERFRKRFGTKTVRAKEGSADVISKVKEVIQKGKK